MIIENDTSKLISLNCKDFGTLNLLPGMNDVDDDHWAQLKFSKGQKGDIAKGIPAGFVHVLLETRKIFEIGESPKQEETAPVKKAAPVKEASEKTKKIAIDASGVPGNAGDAIANVNLTEDVEQLEEWAATESRKTVLKAIHEKIEELDLQ